MKPATESTFYHVTHAKAGSTWINNILHGAFPGRLFERIGSKTELYSYIPGKIYGALFLDYDQFMQLEGSGNHPSFFVIRDPRDTLISLYFSFAISHVESPRILERRRILQELSENDGIEFVFENHAAKIEKIQQSWLRSGATVIRYEDLIAENAMQLPEIFDHLGIGYDRKALMESIETYSFTRQFGRELGERDNASHGRQGLPGDWKNFMTPTLQRLVDEKLGDVLAAGGYKQ